MQWFVYTFILKSQKFSLRLQEGKRRMNAAIESFLCPNIRESRNYLFNANNRTEITQVKRIASLHSFKTNTSIRHKSVSPTELLNTLL